MPKLNTENCSLYVCEKIHQFLSSTKRDAHKRKLVPFFCLTVYIVERMAKELLYYSHVFHVLVSTVKHSILAV